MQKVYFMSADGELFDRKTGEKFQDADVGRIVAICALQPDDVLDRFSYLAVVDVHIRKQEAARIAADDRKPTEPVDVPFVRQAMPAAVVIFNHRTLHVVN